LLVLSRKVNQSIVIGEDIEVMVIEIKGDTVKIGLKAPRSIPVYRSEVYAEIRAENQRACSSQGVVAAEILKKALTKPSSPLE
jgi:carbon storage regulator